MSSFLLTKFAHLHSSPLETGTFSQGLLKPFKICHVGFPSFLFWQRWCSIDFSLPVGCLIAHSTFQHTSVSSWLFLFGHKYRLHLPIPSFTHMLFSAEAVTPFIFPSVSPETPPGLFTHALQCSASLSFIAQIVLSLLLLLLLTFFWIWFPLQQIVSFSHDKRLAYLDLNIEVWCVFPPSLVCY